MSHLILIRHTRPDIPEGLCYGRTDVPYILSEFEDWVRHEPWPEKIHAYSSPLRRCLDLANKAMPTAVCVDERLIELDFGTWENRLWSDIPRHESDPWTADYTRLSPPGGENLLRMNARLEDFVLGLKRGDHTHVVFSHSGVIRLLLLAAYQETIDKYFDRHVDFGSTWVLPRIPEREDFARLIRDV
ncbi:MAG: phosphoglycerate mutase [Proteobacteria bacterium]|nr:MAG: phosphoglycerate mutase [Pseudomonadota bacterium]